MKNRLFTIMNIFFIFVPWSILPLRTNAWALESPAAQIIIASYALFMVGCGVFAIFCYTRQGIRHTIMKICLVVHLLYMAGGGTALIMMLPGLIQ